MSEKTVIKLDKTDEKLKKLIDEIYRDIEATDKKDYVPLDEL